MRFLWVDDGNDPDWGAIEEHQIDGLYFHMFESEDRANKIYLKEVQARGYEVGVYVSSNWDQVGGYDSTGAEFAKAVSSRLGEIVSRSSAPWFPRVSLDEERHDPKLIIDMVTEWRRLRPHRYTAWTMEPMQGGWMTPAMVQAVKKARIRVSPQLYGGNMEPYPESAVVDDLLRAGFERERITPKRDAKLVQPLPERGFYFTMGRLPR